MNPHRGRFTALRLDQAHRLGAPLMGNEADPSVSVAGYIRNMIDSAADSTMFRALLIQVMSRPGRVLSRETPAKWPAFVLDTAEALGGDPEVAVIAAGLVEFTIAATDIVDDLVDDEWDGPASPERALNASLALSYMAQHCLSDLAARLGAERALVIGKLVAGGVLAACAGEDLDLVLETVNDVTEEVAYEMTRRKSGSLVAMACQTGSAVATTDREIIEGVGILGAHIGVIFQLLNDVAGISPSADRRASDLRRRKKTLPVAYALRCATDEGHHIVRDWYRPDAAVNDRDEMLLAETIRDLGALHLTLVVANVEKRQAEAVIQNLVARTKNHAILRLRHLIPAVSALESRACVL